MASLYQEQGDGEAAARAYGAAAAASSALYGEATRWSTASRWKQANALAQLGRQASHNMASRRGSSRARNRDVMVRAGSSAPC